MGEVELIAATALSLCSLYNYIKCLKAYKIKKIGKNVNTHQRRRRQRRWWLNSIHRARTLNGMENFFNKTVSDGEFTNLCRMSITDFEFLLGKLEPLIKKQTKMRVPIPPKIRLAITLRYLGTGESYRKLHQTFKVSEPAISSIVPEVCKAINIVLKDQIKLPESKDEWLAVEEGFRCKFPRCVGAIVGKRIVVKNPLTNKNKGTHTILLMALIDSDFNFIFADTGEQRRIGDGSIYPHCPIWHKIEDGSINLPPDTPLPERNVNVPYVFIGDGTLPLHRNVMEQFPGNHDTDTAEHTFNSKLSSVRMISENVFGVLATVFGILKNPIELQVEKVPHIVMTCILLHNFLRRSEISRNIYTPTGTLDSVVDGQLVDGSWRKNVNNKLTIRPLPRLVRCIPNDISEIQSEFADYFHKLDS